MNRIGAVATSVFAVVALGAVGLAVSPASAQTLICSGVAKADVKKCDPDSGYADAMASSHWGMYGGHNCTNYTAYRLGKNGVARPSYNLGNANTWASRAKSNGVTVDANPSVGAIGAWPGRNHVVYVEEVGSGYLITSEDNYPGYYAKGMFRKIKVVKGESAYPTQFIHFKDQLTSAVPKVTGTTKVGSMLTAAAGSWTPSGISLTYQWLRDGAVISSATSTSYVLSASDLAHKISIRVTGTKSGLNTQTKTSAATAAIAAGTVSNTAVPKVTGTTKVGSTLTAASGIWTPTGLTYAYQWLRGGVVIPGATKSTYVPTGGDLATKLSVRMTGTKAGYTSLTKTSAQTAAIALGTLTNSAAPTITGTPKVGQPLTAAEGTWTPGDVTFGYQWFTGVVAIPDANGKTFVPTMSQLDKTLTVRVTANKDGFTTLAKDSAPTTVVGPGTVSNTAAPSITGASLVGTWINVDPGTWAPTGVGLTYQWYRSGKAVDGGTRTTYKLTKADLGKTVAVKVTGTKAGYTAFSKTSKATDVVKAPVLVNSAAPTITGKATVGTWIKLAPGTWSPSGVGFTYQWYRSGKAVKGGTRDVYKLTSADRGKTVAVKVTGAKPGYPNLSKTSKPTAKVK
ncbi:MAG: CHAP domain-containing protein [Actinomycetota bacterium]|nr:CHAP domain-containing protein [Actinomycetota bacterium]